LNAGLFGPAVGSTAALAPEEFRIFKGLFSGGPLSSSPGLPGLPLPGHFDMNDYDRWARMITPLAASSEARGWMPSSDELGAARHRHSDVAPMASSGSARRRNAIIAVERQTGSSVLVSWSDSTRCRYDEQRWVRGKSRRRGFCAVSGRTIAVGDSIYKPQLRGTRPANGAEMVLASELERLIASQNMR
jgi:hypothetical protein